MPWNTLTDLAHGQLVTEAHMDDLRENIEHNGGLKVGQTALSAFADAAIISGLTYADRGTYTGDGAGAAGSGGQVVALGDTFTPNVLFIAPADPNNGVVYFFDGSNLNTTVSGVTAMGSGSFTVSDGGTDAQPNKTGHAYVYLALLIQESA